MFFSLKLIIKIQQEIKTDFLYATELWQSARDILNNILYIIIKEHLHHI